MLDDPAELVFQHPVTLFKHDPPHSRACLARGDFELVAHLAAVEVLVCHHQRLVALLQKAAIEVARLLGGRLYRRQVLTRLDALLLQLHAPTVGAGVVRRPFLPPLSTGAEHRRRAAKLKSHRRGAQGHGPYAVNTRRIQRGSAGGEQAGASKFNARICAGAQNTRPRVCVCVCTDTYKRGVLSGLEQDALSLLR